MTLKTLVNCPNVKKTKKMIRINLTIQKDEKHQANRPLHYMSKIDQKTILKRFDQLVVAVAKKYKGDHEKLRKKGLKGLSKGIYEYMQNRRDVDFESYLLYFIKLYIEK